MSKSKNNTFRIQFHNNNRIYELYAHEVSQSEMMGFIEIGQIIFGEHTKLLIDPAEEKLKHEFAGVKHTYIPHHSIIRIDEVEKTGHSKISTGSGDSNVAPFPIFSPGSENSKP